MTQHYHNISAKTRTASVVDPDLTPYAKAADLAALTKRVAALEKAAPVPTPTPTPTPTGWAAKPAFMSYPASAPITLWSKNGVEIKNLSFSGTDVNTTAIDLHECTGLIWIHDCDFSELGWDAIDILSCSGTVKIEWCRFGNVGNANPAGNGRAGADFVQFDHSKVSGYIANCKGIGKWTEDLISFVNESGGTSAADLFQVHDCQWMGTTWTSTSGTGGMLADNSTTGGHIWYHHNTILNPGQVGCAISMGVDCHITDNVIYGAKRTGSNVGIYTPYTAGSPNPGGHEVARNRVFWLNAAGGQNSYWNGGASGTIAGEATNVWQDTTIDPAKLVVVL